MVKGLIKRGLFGANFSGETKTAKSYQKSINETTFTSTSAFLNMLKHPVSFSDHLEDNITLRGILMCNAYGLVHSHDKCPQCNGPVQLRSNTRAQYNTVCYHWTCVRGGHKGGHLQSSVHGIGIFANLHPYCWAPMLHLITMLRRGDRWASIESEMKDAYGMNFPFRLAKWRRMYQDAAQLSTFAPIPHHTPRLSRPRITSLIRIRIGRIAEKRGHAGEEQSGRKRGRSCLGRKRCGSA